MARKDIIEMRLREVNRLKAVQEAIDGSHHDWLEDRGPELVLMGYIT